MNERVQFNQLARKLRLHHKGPIDVLQAFGLVLGKDKVAYPSASPTDILGFTVCPAWNGFQVTEKRKNAIRESLQWLQQERSVPLRMVASCAGKIVSVGRAWPFCRLVAALLLIPVAEKLRGIYWEYERDLQSAL